MEDVVESGPAWESGVRKGDIIVTVNDWLIVLMDRAQVRTTICFLNDMHLHLFIIHNGSSFLPKQFFDLAKIRSSIMVVNIFNIQC